MFHRWQASMENADWTNLSAIWYLAVAVHHAPSNTITILSLDLSIETVWGQPTYTLKNEFKKTQMIKTLKTK